MPSWVGMQERPDGQSVAEPHAFVQMPLVPDGSPTQKPLPQSLPLVHGSQTSPLPTSVVGEVKQAEPVEVP